MVSKAPAQGKAKVKITSTGKFVKYDEAGTDDGRRVAAGVLWNELDPVAGDIEATVIKRDAEVIEAKLTGIDANGKARAVTLIERGHGRTEWRSGLHCWWWR